MFLCWKVIVLCDTCQKITALHTWTWPDSKLCHHQPRLTMDFQETAFTEEQFPLN